MVASQEQPRDREGGVGRELLNFVFYLTFKTICINYSDTNTIQLKNKTCKDSQLPSIVNLNYLLFKLRKGERT